MRQISHDNSGFFGAVDPFYGADKGLATAIENFLLEHYPRQARHIRATVDHHQGYVKIYIPALMGAINGYKLSIPRLAIYNDFVKLMHAAVGELLERYRLRRDRGFTDEDFAIARRKVPIIGLHNSKVPT